MDSGYFFYSVSRGEKQDVGRFRNEKDTCLSLSCSLYPPGTTWTQPAAGETREEVENGTTLNCSDADIRITSIWSTMLLLGTLPDAAPLTPGPTLKKKKIKKNVKTYDTPYGPSVDFNLLHNLLILIDIKFPKSARVQLLKRYKLIRRHQPLPACLTALTVSSLLGFF